MVLLEEEPREFLSSLIKNFELSDTRQISRINDSLRTLSTARAKEQDTVRSTLRQISRKSDFAEQSLKETEKAHREANHPERMTRLDREKFALGKAVNELESKAHSLEGRLARLREQARNVEEEDPYERALGEQEQVLLRLMLYRSLGIELEGDGAGGFSRATVGKLWEWRLGGIYADDGVVNEKKSDIQTIKITNKLPPNYYANQFWRAMGP